MTIDDAANQLYQSVKNNDGVQGSGTGNDLIIIYVSKDTPIQSTKIPATYEGYPVKVKVINQMIAH